MNKLPKRMVLLEQWLHDSTGLEFAGYENGRFGIQCTNRKQHAIWLKLRKKRIN